MARKNSIEMYSTHNQGKSAAAERFIRTLNNKNYNYMIIIISEIIRQLKWNLCKIKRIY